MAQYDAAKRRRAVRRGRERGVWVFVPAVELRAIDFDPADPPPWYRIWPRRRTILLQFYREP